MNSNTLSATPDTVFHCELGDLQPCTVRVSPETVITKLAGSSPPISTHSSVDHL